MYFKDVRNSFWVYKQARHLYNHWTTLNQSEFEMVSDMYPDIPILGVGLEVHVHVTTLIMLPLPYAAFTVLFSAPTALVYIACSCKENEWMNIWP